MAIKFVQKDLANKNCELKNANTENSLEKCVHKKGEKTMRKAILDENKKVIGFEPMEKEMSEQAKAQRQKQVDYIAKKYGFDKGTK